MMEILRVAPNELQAEYALRNTPNCPSILLATSFRSGVDLLVLCHRVGMDPFVPEFRCIWWRQPFRWARNWEGTSHLAKEVRRLWNRESAPFFASATSQFSTWENVWNGSRADLEDHIEFVLPSSDELVTRASAFLSRWIEAFDSRLEYAPRSGLHGDVQAQLEALTAMPGGTSEDADDALARRVRMCLTSLRANGGKTAPTLGVFPNVMEIMLPAGMADEARSIWNEILDLRLEFVSDQLDPRHYQHIQGLASRSQWEREFVHETTPQQSRGNQLIGSTRMTRLFEVGRNLERRFPLLAVDPFDGAF